MLVNITAMQLLSVKKQSPPSSLSLRPPLSSTSRRQNKKMESKKMMYRRRQSKDCFSPCHSSNRKRLPGLHPHHPLRWSATATESELDPDDNSHVSDTTRSLPSSDLLLMMVAASNGIGKRCESSFGSCAWSMGSALDRCPTTPSPVCSPISSFSGSHSSELLVEGSHVPDPDESTFAVLNQALGGNNLKEAGGREECKPHVRMPPMLPPLVTPCPSPVNKVEGDASAKQNNPTPKSNPNGRPSRSACRYLLFESNESVAAGNCNDDERLRLPAVTEDKEERVCKKGRYPTQSSHFSADERYYTGTSGGSGYENSDSAESEASEHLRVDAQARPTSANVFESEINSEVEANLTAWKEAKTHKLLNKLRKEEAAIVEWEKQQISNAKMEMQKLEMKLEKNRKKGIGKMQKKIRCAQKKAGQEKLKQRARTAKKITRVTKAFEKVTKTGKLPWKILCF